MAELAGLQAGVPILILMPLTWLLFSWLLGRLTGRLQQLAEAIAKRSLDSRDPVPAAEVPAEVLPLVQGMNVLTGRLQDALDKQANFIPGWTAPGNWLSSCCALPAPKTRPAPRLGK